MVLELREFLAEHIYTCFFTHYYFEHDGKRLNDYTELNELAKASAAESDRTLLIYMKPGNASFNQQNIDKYDEKSARAHIKRFKDILTTPPVLNA